MTNTTNTTPEELQAGLKKAMQIINETRPYPFEPEEERCLLPYNLFIYYTYNPRVEPELFKLPPIGPNPPNDKVHTP